MEKILKARKNHSCDLCDGIILKGEHYELIKLRGPKYQLSSDPEDDGKQIGVEYNLFRHHLPELNCHWPEECKKGNHSKVEYYDGDPYSSTCGEDFVYCENCGTNLKFN